MWKKILSRFVNTVATTDSLARRYQAAHDDLDPDVFTLKGAKLSLAEEDFQSDGMGNWFCEINYACRKDREPLIFKITQQEYEALGR